MPASASYCQVDAPNVMVLTLKRAEDGRGLILRLVETEGRACEAVVALPLRSIQEGARQTNLVEENGPALTYEGHAVRVPMRPYATADRCGSWSRGATRSLATHCQRA